MVELSNSSDHFKTKVPNDFSFQKIYIYTLVWNTFWWSCLKNTDDWWSNLDHFHQVLRDGEYLHHDWILKARKNPGKIWQPCQKWILSFKDESQQGDDCSMTAIAWASKTELHKTPGNHVDAQEDVTFSFTSRWQKTSDTVGIGTRFGGCKWNNKLRADRRMICRAFWYPVCSNFQIA